MKTVIIQLEEKSDYKKVIGAIKQLKGVQRVELATEEQFENLSMLKACDAARGTELVSEDEILYTLK
jgi:hypothetical protein